MTTKNRSKFYDKEKLELVSISKNSRLKNITGKVFNKLTVLGYAGKIGRYHYWFVECECGNITRIRRGKLGVTQSCGCARSINSDKASLKHGMSKTAGFRSWCSMKSRCFNTKSGAYERYGARGITVCSRWNNSYEAFLSDMGQRPSKSHSIDRINSSLHYSCGKCGECKQNNWPANCRWATRTEQQNNLKNNLNITIKGETRTLAQWCAGKGRNHYIMVWKRIKKGWDVETALSTPPRGTQ